MWECSRLMTQRDRWWSSSQMGVGQRGTVADKGPPLRSASFE